MQHVSHAQLRSLLSLVLTVLIVSGCVSGSRSDIPPQITLAPAVTGYGEIRFYADAPPEEFSRQEHANHLPLSVAASGSLKMLALSSGGSAGAFGAGVLVGWSKTGTRPQFDLVTGVSAGALIAPFAFLGSAEDAILRDLFTSGIATSLFKPKMAVLGQSILDGGPLQGLVEKYIDEPFFRRIAAAHRAGRRLMIVTTNLDTQRAVVWNMGAIATSGAPAARRLFIKVLVASASVPAAFPAVKIAAFSNRKKIQELHTDGGVTRQVYTFADAVIGSRGEILKQKLRPGKSDIYIVVNNEYDANYQVVADSTLSVASRAYSTILKANTQSTVNSTYVYAKQRKIGFNMMYVDRVVPYDSSDPFNTEYMRELFAMGYRKGRRQAWHKRPPLGQMMIAGTANETKR